MTCKRGSKLVVHWNKEFKEGMAYVMLGRTQDLNDIYIYEDDKEGKFDPKNILVNESALEETKRIRSKFQEIEAKEESLWNDNFTITYLNIQRLKPHFVHLKADHLVMKSNVISLAETWLKPSDDVTLDGYNGVQINVGDGKGLATFIQEDHAVEWQTFSNEKSSAILMSTSDLDVIFLYLSQDFDVKALLRQLNCWIDNEKKIAIIGKLVIILFANTQAHVTS